MPRFPRFCQPAYMTPSPVVGAYELMNMYVQPNRGGGPDYIYVPAPGGAPFLTLPYAPIRGMFSEEGRAFAMSTRLTEFFADGTTTDRGAIEVDQYPAQATTNGDGGDQILITSGNKGYVFDRTVGSLTEVVTGARFAGMLDTFFFVLDTDTSTIKASDSLDGTTWNGLAIDQRATASDPWRSMVVSGSKVYLLGERTSDVYFNEGLSPFPLSPFRGGTIPYGISAPYSAVDFDGAVTWLTQSKNGDRRVVSAAGYGSADPISSPGMEAIIGQYARVDDAEAFVYEEYGVSHYIISFPNEKATWDYSAGGGWTNLGTYISGRNAYDAWHARSHVFAFGLHMVGDRTTGRISLLSSNYGTDVGGGVLRRVIMPPTIDTQMRRLVVGNLGVNMRTGMGLTSGQGVDPTVMLQMSYDDGLTWGSEYWKSAGRLGQTNTQVRWTQLGSGYQPRARFVMTDPVQWQLRDAFVNNPL